MFSLAQALDLHDYELGWNEFYFRVLQAGRYTQLSKSLKELQFFLLK